MHPDLDGRGREPRPSRHAAQPASHECPCRSPSEVKDGSHQQPSSDARLLDLGPTSRAQRQGRMLHLVPRAAGCARTGGDMVQPSDNGSRVPECHPTLARHFDELFAAELERIARVRKNKAARYATDRDTTGTAGREGGAPRGRPLAGLALSGGGIRSAAFGLGVLQALANEGLLKRFDYLSTVSGGGYIGSALTWFLSEVWRRPDGSRFGTGEDDHPLGRRGIGAKTGTENDRIDHIRGFGNYLRPTPELWTGSAAALVLQSMAYVVMLWFFPLVVLFLVFDRLVWLARYTAGLPDPGLGQNLVWLWLGTALATLLALLRVAWLPGGLRQFFDAARSRDPAGYPSRLARQNSLGKWLVLGLGCALGAAPPGVRPLAHEGGAR